MAMSLCGPVFLTHPVHRQTDTLNTVLRCAIRGAVIAIAHSHAASRALHPGYLLVWKGRARRNVFVSGGGYKFVRTWYNIVVKVVCLKFWHKPHLWLGGTGRVQVLNLGVQCAPLERGRGPGDEYTRTASIRCLYWCSFCILHRISDVF